MKLFLNMYDSPQQTLMIGTTEKNLVWIDWFQNLESQLNSIKKHLKTDDFIFEETTLFHQVKKELNTYFEGTLKEFKTPIELIGTDFQKKVWKSLLTIPYGETSTYSEQSLKTGDIKAIRAVASANGSNPISIIVPCHRIIGKNGSLTGYRGGLKNKKFLLDHEAKFSHRPFQSSLF
ncbi:MAG: methylated-DNA--[protein]-cysteine S-methyltransferase [Flavobacteriales bacterium]